MDLIKYIINKLAGYDVSSKKTELEKRIDSLVGENDKLKTELETIKALADEKKQQAIQLSNRLNAYRLNYSKTKRAKDELQNRYTEETTKLEESLKIKEAERLLLQEKVNSIQSEKDDLINQVVNLKAIITQKTNEAESNQKTITTLTRGKSDLEEKLSNQEQTIKIIQDENENIKRDIEEKRKLLTEKEMEIEQKNTSIIQLQEELHQNQSSTDEIRKLENQIQVLQEKLSDSRRESEILNSQLEQKRNEIREINNVITEKKERFNKLQIQLDDANSTIQNQEQEIQKLNEKNKNQHPETNTPEQPIEPNNASEHVEGQETDRSGDSKPQPKEKSEKTKSKEEKAIEMSGKSMMDFPPIVNDSNKHVHRSIEYVFDKDGNKIYANDFFGRSAEEIARISRRLEEANQMGKSDFICGMCHRPVKIAHRIINGTESLFFAHANHNEYCAWIPYSTSSKDDEIFDDELEVESTEQENATKPHSRVLKEMIFSLLCKPESEKLGISDVKCDAIIRSCVPYMKWRRPDISFRYKDRDVVIVLQRKKHDLRMIVDRDVFFRLNNHHVIWIFGADSDVSYDYMRLSNYKNTLFDCHRNVFVFDTEAQQKSEEKNTLCVKYNWLDENDGWAVTHASSGSNGFIADISDFIFDDEYCKPYIKEANEPYFRLHPEAKKQYHEARKSREQLLKEFEDKWKGEPSYEEALRSMKLRNERATLFSYMGLWGFRFNTTILIQPVFSEQPEDLHNGFFMVKQNGTAGLVNYYGEAVMDWTILECERLKVDISNNRVLFLANGSWGVADFKGKILIKAQFIDIRTWSDTIYRICMSNLWGLQNIEDQTVADCIYDEILGLRSGQAEAILPDKDKPWKRYKGLLDSNGNAIDTNTNKLNDKYIAFEQFEKWGVRTYDGQNLITPSYDEILPWAEETVRVKNNGKWGVVNLPKGEIIIPIKYDSIEELVDGRARITYVGVANIVDAKGNIQSEESIKLLNGFVKSKIGGKWGIEKSGVEIVPHKYDEIGSFRQRLIGVINSSIIKLNAYYDYPIHISGRCIDVMANGIKVDISGVPCNIPNVFIRNAGFEGKISKGSILNNIAFSNLIFGQKRYYLRFVSKSQMQKKMSHGDKDSDFNMNEIVLGTITDIMRYKKGGGIKVTKVKLKINDGRETMVPKRFFKEAGFDITKFNKGDSLRIEKIGYDDELDQTTWRII